MEKKMISEIDIRDWEEAVEDAYDSADGSAYGVWRLCDMVKKMIDEQKKQTAALLRKKEE